MKRYLISLDLKTWRAVWVVLDMWLRTEERDPGDPEDYDLVKAAAERLKRLVRP